MTASANTLGKRPDGSVRRYGLDSGTKLIHVIATKTGKLTYCGITPKIVATPNRASAISIEKYTDPASKGYAMCPICSASITPQPDPVIWGPKREKQKG